MADRLPAFVEPMLAERGPPFDSDEHFFEVKWDGFRGIAFVEGDRTRLLSRRQRDLARRFPELDFLAELEPGLVLDGEIVIFREGKPDFEALLEREHGTSDTRRLARALPAVYIAFDIMYRGFESRMELPLSARREELGTIVGAFEHPKLIFSDGIAGAGRAFFEKATEQGLEGIVAKELDSPYLSGKRTDAWTKIKRSERAHCAIIGYAPAEGDDLKSLIIATNVEGELRCVGKVGSGLGERLRQQLLGQLRERHRDSPLIPCQETGIWVEPGLYCTVTYVERTKSGNLRAPVFHELITDE